MRMRASGILLALAMTAGAGAVEAPKAPPAPKPREEPRLSAREPSAEWIAAFERLRSHPVAGEIKNAGISAHIAEVYEVQPEDRAKMARLLEDYEAELLKQAAKFEEELKALRGRYEAQMLQAVPEVRRENARKALDVSHQQWVTPHDRETSFRRQATARARDYREKKALLGAEENAAALAEMRAWTKQQLDRIKLEEEAAVNAVKALLSADEQARLEKHNRNRVKQD